MATDLMPAAFIGHGSPMNAIETNRYTEAWRTFGELVGKPRAALVISAHWYINATAVTAMSRPRTIHDFYGFPRDLFAFEYPAEGDPSMAEEIAEVAHPTWVGADADSWGLDHGTWSVLAHLFPKADVPVVQLSINGFKGLDYHFELATRLAALRERGILILGSGNIVHNLGAVDFQLGDTGFDWAHRFDETTMACLTTDASEVLELEDHPDFALAAPTPDHFIPMLYLAGIAAAAGEPCEVLVDGYLAGSLTMTSYAVGAPSSPLSAATSLALGDAAVDDLHGTDGTPSDDTNL